jgi:P27 family predicted phage terminase small subunit
MLRGNPGQRRLGREPEPTVPAAVPDAPSYLIGYACDEWHRVIGELHALGLFTIFDLHPLAAYCQAFHTWRTALEALQKMAERDPHTSGLLIRSATGDARINPLQRAADRAADAMVRYASEFGFSPAARARIAAGVGGFSLQAPSKFDGLIA